MVNPFVVNPFVVNPFVVNPFVVNSAFTMAPSDDAGTKSDDGTTKAPPASNEVNVTLRAFKIAQSGGLKNGVIYKPWEDTPSLVIVPQACDPDNPGSGCHIASVSPDLVIKDFDTTSVSASAGGTLVGFPEGGWTLYNEGLEGQEIGDATSEDGDIQHGFYICGVGYIDTWPADQPLDLAPCAQLPEYLVSIVSPLALGDSENFDPVDLSIPADLGEGDYYLVLYVDDALGVPERTETNNWVAVLLTVDGNGNGNLPPVIDQDCLQQTYNEDPEGSISCTLATDPNEDSLTVVVTNFPEHGEVDFDGTHYSYGPDANYNGTDSFTVVISDGEFDVEATVEITLLPVNDPPVAYPAIYQHLDGGVIFGILQASDVDAGDVLTFAQGQTPSPAGQVQIIPETGEFYFFPYQELPNNPDAFSFIVSDQSGATATAIVEILAFQGEPWNFVGFGLPWEPLQYSIGDDQTVDLSWYYQDPTGAIVPSSMAEPFVWIDRFPLNDPCVIPDDSVPLGSWMTTPDGYDEGETWHLDFHGGYGEGCYHFAIYHPYTGQIDAADSFSEGELWVRVVHNPGGGG